MKKPNHIQVPTIKTIAKKPVTKTTSAQKAPIQPIVASKDEDEWAKFLGVCKADNSRLTQKRTS